MLKDYTPDGDFERFRTAVMGGQPDRVPLAEIIVDKPIKEAFLGRPIDDLAAEVAFWTQAGYDQVPLILNMGLKSGVSDREYSHAQVQKKVTARYGEYRGQENERIWGEEHGGLIASLEDLEGYPWPDPERMDYSHFAAVSAYLPSRMKSVVICGGLLYAVWDLMGFERFCYATGDNPELVDALFGRVGDIMVRAIAKTAEFPATGAIWFNNDIAYTDGLLVSRALVRKYIIPRIAQIGELCQRKGLPLLFHSDGRFVDLIPDLIEAGVNALHPIEPKAMDIRALKHRFGGRLALVGNVDVNTLCMGTPEEVAQEVKDLLRDVAPGGGYCLSSSNSVPDYARPENYLAMVETALRLGRYPIAGQ